MIHTFIYRSVTELAEKWILVGQMQGVIIVNNKNFKFVKLNEINRSAIFLII